MAERLAVGECAAVGDQGARLVGYRASAAAVGAGGLSGEGLGLQFEEGGEGAFGQAAGGRGGDLFEGEEVDIQSGAGVTEGAAGNNFAPLGGGVADVVELLGGQRGSGHVESFLGLAPSDIEALTFSFYGQAL